MAMTLLVKLEIRSIVGHAFYLRLMELSSHDLRFGKVSRKICLFNSVWIATLLTKDVTEVGDTLMDFLWSILAQLKSHARLMSLFHQSGAARGGQTARSSLVPNKHTMWATVPTDICLKQTCSRNCERVVRFYLTLMLIKISKPTWLESSRTETLSQPKISPPKTKSLPSLTVAPTVT